MIHTRVFLNNRIQTVRLPKALAMDYNVREVTVVAVGRTRVIAPIGESWDSWFYSPGVTPDFLAERDQPAVHGHPALDEVRVVS